VRSLNFSQQFRDEQLPPDHLTSESAVAFVNSTEVRKSMKSLSCLYLSERLRACARLAPLRVRLTSFKPMAFPPPQRFAATTTAFQTRSSRSYSRKVAGKTFTTCTSISTVLIVKGISRTSRQPARFRPAWVSGNGQSNLVLNLDTNAAGLDLEYCVIDQNFNHTCTPYAGGIMNVTWQKTGQYTNTNTGINTMTFTNFTVKTNFRNTTSSATAQGTIFGTQYTPGGDFRQLGTGHNGGIEIDKP
jgi:hypothetical protein